jgi:hypothetical protein
LLYGIFLPVFKYVGISSGAADVEVPHWGNVRFSPFFRLTVAIACLAFLWAGGL